MPITFSQAGKDPGKPNYGTTSLKNSSFFQLENSMGIIYLIKSFWRQNLVSMFWTRSLFYVWLAVFVLVAATSRNSKSKNSRHKSHCSTDKTFFEKQRERTVWLPRLSFIHWCEMNYSSMANQSEDWVQDSCVNWGVPHACKMEIVYFNCKIYPFLLLMGRTFYPVKR